MRTPLAAIKGYASILLQEDVVWSLADQCHFLQTINNEADWLAQLVSNLLDLSRQEAGLIMLEHAPTSVQSLVAKIIEQPGSPGVTISAQIPDDLPLVNVDSGRVLDSSTSLASHTVQFLGDSILSKSGYSREESLGRIISWQI